MKLDSQMRKLSSRMIFDEYTILNLKAQGAKVDVWGIGTKLITAYDQPALGAVYKIVSIENEAGEMEDTIKISSTAEKVTTPGRKKLYRIIDLKTEKLKGTTLQCTMKIQHQRSALKCSTQSIHLFQSL